MDNFSDRTFFVTSVTAERKPIFRSEQGAKLFLETTLGYRDRGFFRLYEFVVMPDHIHLMLAPKATLALERVMQFIKGGYSHRFGKETGSRMEIWERSFTNHRYGMSATMNSIATTFGSILFARDWSSFPRTTRTHPRVKDSCWTQFHSG